MNSNGEPTPLTAQKADEETDEEDFPTIVVIVKPTGFDVHIDNRIAPPTVAGAAWLVEQMARISFANIVHQQQQTGIVIPNREGRRHPLT